MSDGGKMVSSSLVIGDVVRLEYSPAEIMHKTGVIYGASMEKRPCLSAGNFSRLSVMDIRYVFRLYDRFFFSDFFTAGYRDRLTFYLSGRMTTAAGKLRFRRSEGTYEMGFALQMLFDNFRNEGDEREIGGIVCRDRLEALMRVMEHETVHLIEWLAYGWSSCSGPRFKSICKGIFGHTRSVHVLDTPKVFAGRLQLRVGDRVAFSDKGRRYTGVIKRIGHRVTVLIHAVDGRAASTVGMAGVKAYVPFSELWKA